MPKRVLEDKNGLVHPFCLAEPFFLMTKQSGPQDPEREMFGRLLAAFRKARTSNVAGQVPQDILPTREEIEDELAQTGVFQPAAISWMGEMATARIHDGMSFLAAARDIIREGEPVSADRLRALRIDERRRVGTRFIDALKEKQVEHAVYALHVALHTATSVAGHLHNLHTMKEAGVAWCTLQAPGETTSLPFEQEINGRRLSIDEAITIVKIRGSDIRGSVFVAGAEER
jgi:hypothetical protein